MTVLVSTQNADYVHSVCRCKDILQKLWSRFTNKRANADNGGSPTDPIKSPTDPLKSPTDPFKTPTEQSVTE